MRAITKDALARMDLHSQSWEYASEMVLKSVRMELPTAEVPVSFLKDREGRLSHHKRAGWSAPWKAAWINLRAMFVYGADFFVFKPGLVLLALGLLLTLPLSFGPITIGPVTFSLYWMLGGMTLTVVGLQCFYPRLHRARSCTTTRARPRALARDLPVHANRRRSARSRSCSGIALADPADRGLRRLRARAPRSAGARAPSRGRSGLLAMIVGFTTFAFTLLLHAAADHLACRGASDRAH